MTKNQILFITAGVAAGLSLVAAGCGKTSETVSAAGTKTEGTKDAGTESKDAEESKELTEIHIGFPSSGADWAGGTLAVAEEYGYLDEYLNPLGYDAVLTSFTGAAPAIHEALISGDLDYAYYAGFAGIAAKSNGIDTKLLAVTSFGSGWQLAVSEKSQIQSLADLKGKKIAYQRGATPQMYILKVLEEAGLTENDVELLNSTIPEGISSLSSGAIDAAVISYGQADELVAQGAVDIIHEGINADHDTYFEPSVLAGRTEVVEQEEALNVALLEALLKAKDKIKEDPDVYYELTSEKSGTPLERVRGVALDDLDIAFPLSLDEQYITSLQNIQTFEIENKIIANEVDFDNWVDSSYLKKAVAEYEGTK